jgi:anti-sigma B factor antagonist
MKMPETSNTASTATVRVPNDIDTSTVGELKPQLLISLREHGPTLILDMASVQFIDSMGLGMLVSILKEARNAGGTVHLVNLTREVMRLLQITGLERVFEIGAPYPASS